jgi:hypothetical protein
VTWTVFPIDVLCGGCKQTIPPDQPVLLLTRVRLRRCVACAAGLDVEPNPVEIDLERARLEMDRARGQVVSASPLPRRPARPHHDAKSAAANDRE